MLEAIASMKVVATKRLGFWIATQALAFALSNRLLPVKDSLCRYLKFLLGLMVAIVTLKSSNCYPLESARGPSWG